MASDIDWDAAAAKFGGRDAPNKQIDWDAEAATFGAADSPKPASKPINDALSNPNDAYSVASGVGLSLLDTLKNHAMGAVKGATSLGNFLTGANEERKASQAQFFNENADPNSVGFKTGQLAAEVAGTAGAGGVLGQGIRAFPALARFAPTLAPALESGGFSLGKPAATTLAGKTGDMAMRTGAGAAVGGASAGMVDPDSAGTGAVIGAAGPAVLKAAGAAGKALTGDVSQEVFDLYKKAKNLGIDIPADRIINSRPVNAVAESLKYVPLSGRTGTENRMLSQLNRALSRTFGQDSDNVTMSLRKASDDLGAKFEQTLSSNTVKFDDQFVNELVAAADKAGRTLGKNEHGIIQRQINEIIHRVGPNDQIEGRTLYNIKRELDEIANRNGTEATSAREVKRALMNALDRSLGPNEAAAFAKVRQQYGNMLDLQNIAQNGAEGGVSVGKLATMKNIGNAEVQDLADIAAQFLKGRESPHGGMQRVAMGIAGTLGMGAGGAAAGGVLPMLGAGMVGGRLANTVLNSSTLKNAVLSPAATAGRLSDLAGDPALRALIYNQPNRR